MPFLQTPNTTLYYDIIPQEFTTAPSSTQEVLLVHGFASTPENDFSASLPTLRQHYRLIAPHLHGYGRSSHRYSYSTLYYREDVADLVALLDSLALERVLVLGFSDGGIVSLLLAALHPERVQAVAVLGPQPTVSPQDVAGIRHWLLETPFSPELQEQFAALHGNPYWRSLPAMYVAGQEALVTAGGTLITDAELAAILCPILIMHGKYDKIVPVHYTYTLAQKIPHAQLLVFEAGHAAHIRCVQAYTSAVLHFFQHGTIKPHYA